MIKGFLIKHGRFYSLILTALFLMLLSCGFNSVFAQSIEDSIDDEKIPAGETTTIRHKISGADGEIRPVSVPAVPGLRIDYSGMQRSFQFVNGKTWSGIVFTFIVSGDKPGKYKIPRFIYDLNGKKISTRELSLIVGNGSGARSGRTGNGMQAKLGTAVESTKRRVYTGEPVVFRYYLLSSGLKNIKFIGRENQADAKGFVVKEFKEEIEDVQQNDDTIKYHLYTLIFIPAQTGSLEAGGGTSIISFDADAGFFDFKRQYRVSFENTPVMVLPLPKSPADFKGAVGDFKITAEYSSDQIKTYDEKKINIIIRGKGNLVSLTKPDFEKQIPEVKILTEEVQPEISIKNNEITGEKKFIFTVIPEKAGELNLGPVTFTYFNPAAGGYVTVKTEDISFKAAEGGKSRASRELDADGSEKIDFNYFYILLIIFLIGGIAGGVYFWEKKRTVNTKPKEKVKTPDTPEQTADVKQDYIKDMSSALFRMDKRSFLSVSDNALSDFVRNHGGMSSEEILKFKDEIYLYRFGGGDLTQSKMEEILEKMKKLKSIEGKSE